MTKNRPVITPERAIELMRKHDVKPTGGGWYMVQLIRKSLKQEDVIQARWGDTWRDNQKDYPKPDFWQESTYEDCVEWKFDAETLTLRIKFYQGDMLHGRPVHGGYIRSWDFRITVHDVPVINVLIERMLDDLDQRAQMAVRAFEEERLQRITQKFFDSYLEV